MIVEMRPDANKLLLEPVAIALRKAGFDVHIKNGKGSFLVAAVGPGNIDYEVISGFVGVKRVHIKNDLFVSVHGKDFVEDAEFFKSWN